MTRTRRIALTAVLLVSLPLAGQPLEADTLMQMAIKKELVDGDLKGAIASYAKIVEHYSKNRAVVARALLHMAECHRKLGDAESRRIYERIVQEFPDQQETVAVARDRLGVRPNSLAMRLEMTTRGKGVDMESVASDRRLACGADWSNGDLVLRDMASGANKRILPGTLDGRTLGPGTGVGSYVAWCSISPDQKQVAFTRYLPEETLDRQLWVISTEPGAQPRQVTHNPDFDNVHAQGWSPDGKSVLAKIQRQGPAGDQIAWISIADGSTTVVKSFAWQRYLDYWMKLSPDGRFIAYSAAMSPSSRDSSVPPSLRARSIYVLAADGSSERVLVNSAGINEQPVWTPDGSRILFISDRTGTFDLWSIGVQNGKVAGEPSLVKQNVGPIKNLGMSRTGTYYYLAKSAVEHGALAQLRPSAGMTETFIGIRPTLSPDAKHIAFVRRRAGNPSALDVVLRSLETGEEKIISREGITSVHGWFPDGKAMILAIDKQSAYFRVSIASGEFQEIRGYDQSVFAAGMLAMASDGRTLYVGGRDPQSSGRVNSVLKLDLQTGKHDVLFTLPMELAIADAFQLNPDGRTLALMTVNSSVARDSSDGRVVLTVATDGSGSRELLKGHRETLSGLAWNEDGSALFFGMRGANDVWQIMSIASSGGVPKPAGLSMESRRISINTSGSRMVIGGMTNVNEMWALDGVLSVLK